MIASLSELGRLTLHQVQCEPGASHGESDLVQAEYWTRPQPGRSASCPGNSTPAKRSSNIWGRWRWKPAKA